MLFGPRGTGKSTWIRHHFSGVPWYDLLDSQECLRLAKNPSLLFHELETKPPQSWIVIDEVQKAPELLNEVHRLIEEKKLRFILSGSSARKLKRGSANLLAGRAITTHLYPLVSAEVGFDLKSPDFFTKGMMPLAYKSGNPDAYLRSYVTTYLKEEIQAEALTRNLGSFARFLEIAARQNGQLTHASSIARDAMVERKTVENYFQMLVDTLVGYWLPAWKLKSANKQVSSPKFYFFDSGVARALSGRLPYPPTREETGFLVETSLLNEIRAYLSYHELYYEIFFWKNYNNLEVDFLLETKQGFVAIECKAASSWDKKFNKGLKKIREELGSSRAHCYGVYQGQRPVDYDGIKIFPMLEFLKRLWDGEVIQ